MRRLCASATALMMLTGASHGATSTATFTVQMTIQASCTISGSATLDFGTGGVLATNTDQTTTFQVQCTNTTPYTIALDTGVNGGTVAARLMSSGGATISYTLYKDAARTTLWGTSGGALANGTGTGSGQTYTVYGRVPSQTSPAPGTYTDTITITVSY